MYFFSHDRCCVPQADTQTAWEVIWELNLKMNFFENMKKLTDVQMIQIEGGKCKWWKAFAGFAGIALGPVTGGASAVAGVALGVSTCI